MAVKESAGDEGGAAVRRVSTRFGAGPSHEDEGRGTSKEERRRLFCPGTRLILELLLFWSYGSPQWDVCILRGDPQPVGF